MAEVALYHHVLDLTPGMVEFAGILRNAGHTVHTPTPHKGFILVWVVVIAIIFYYANS